MQNNKIKFILELAKSLHECGLPSHRMEAKMEKFCKNIQVEADFFVSTGSIFASITEDNHINSHMIKISHSDLDLSKIEYLEKIILKAQENEANFDILLNELNKLNMQKPTYSSRALVFSFAISTASATSLFGGNIPEILASFLIGFGIGFMFSNLKYFPGLAKIIVFIATLLSVFIVNLFENIFYGFQKEITIISSLIILIPGFSFTVSITELVNNHFISGISRLTASFITFAMIAIGIVVGTKTLSFIQFPLFSNIELSHYFWIKWIALIFVPFGFMVLFKAQKKDYFWIALACWLAYFTNLFFSTYFDATLSIFFSAFILGLFSNLFAKYYKRNESIMLVPGMILLVPGALGFLGVSNLIQSNIMEGIQIFLTMFGTALALVFGLLFSNLLFHEK